MSLFETINGVTNIVGGSPSVQGRFPFQAALLRNDNHFCGGSLIAPNVVLTAARCGQGIATHVALDCVNITDLSDCEVIEVVNSSIFEDPDDDAIFGVDVQVLVLRNESAQTPVTLASPGFDLPVGQDVTVAGWGALSPANNAPGRSDGILLEVNLETVSQESCDAQYREIIGFQGDGYGGGSGLRILEVEPFEDVIINEFKLCADADGRAACFGDSGGPLFLRCDAAKADVQVGVMSAAIGCAYEGIPGVYSSVFNPELFDFIENVVNAEGHALTTIDSISDFCVVGGTQPSEELSDPPTPFPTLNLSAWTCDPVFFSSNDGCDCDCGIPDPDCQFDNRDDVFNCQEGDICVNSICVDPKNTSAPTFGPTFSPTPVVDESEDLLADFFSSTGGIIVAVFVGGVLVALGAAFWFKAGVNSSSKTDLSKERGEEIKAGSPTKEEI